MNQPQKHLIHLTEDVQVSEIIHLLLVSSFHPLCIWPLSLFSKILFCLLTSQYSSALSKMESADCCKWPDVQINGKDKSKWQEYVKKGEKINKRQSSRNSYFSGYTYMQYVHKHTHQLCSVRCLFWYHNCINIIRLSPVGCPCVCVFVSRGTVY